MTFYSKCEPEDLISMTQSGVDAAFSELVHRYMPMINKAVYGFVSPGIRYDEVFSEACVALHKAALSYDLQKKDVTFGLYAKICLYRRLYDMSSKAEREVETVGIDVDSLYTECTVESRMLEKERMRRYLERVRKVLSEYEYRVFLLYLDGKKTAQIAKELSRDVKSVENAKSRMFRHLREESELFSDI